MSYDEFQDPPQPGRFTPAEWLGHLLLCEPQRYIESVLTQNGPSDAIEGTITVLTAQGGPHVIVGARVFQNQLIASLREAIGQRPVLGRLGQGQAQPGRSPAWILTPTSPEDKQYASNYLATRQAQQFTEPTPNAQPQGYGAPSPQDQQWATQQRYTPELPAAAPVYVPPGVTTNVVPAPQVQLAPNLPPYHAPNAVANPAQAPTPAPQPPAPAPAQAPVPNPVTPAGPVAQAGAQPPASSVPEMDDEQFKGMPEDVQKLLDAARYARLHSA